ncbi:MAG TPA: ATP synthase subunit I [Steroidobacteraceae bacterium]|nr:ATP synthase subunit I [Steroidobacteraceae bacterium]
MTLPPFNSLPAWATILALALHVFAGIAAGALYFRGLGWSTRRFAGGGGAGMLALSGVLRLALLGMLLALVAQEGARPLLVTSLGVLIARAIVVRRVKEAAP